MKYLILLLVIIITSCSGFLYEGQPRSASTSGISIIIENSYYSYFLEIYQLYIEEGHIDNSLTFEDWLLLNGL